MCFNLRYTCALELLALNAIPSHDYALSVRELLRVGRRKLRNIFIKGDEGCGKSFLLDPLEKIYSVLTTPASKYGWADIEDKQHEVVYLNDFRWGPGNMGPDGTGLIEWDVLLRLLDGSSVKMKRPRNLFSTDAELPRSNTIPVFANGADMIESVCYGNGKQREQMMMDKRWKLYAFHHRFADEVRVDLDPCGACFARLALLGEEE